MGNNRREWKASVGKKRGEAMKVKFTTDLDLQVLAVEAGREYVQAMWPSLDDVERKAWLQNAAAAGFIRGWRAHEEGEEE
jgi:hypothetical protein